MSVTGERKQLLKDFEKVLIGWDITAYTDEIAKDLLAQVPKKEATTFHIRETPTLKVRYYVCGKCDGRVLEVPARFCTYCGRRVISLEDDTLCQ